MKLSTRLVAVCLLMSRSLAIDERFEGIDLRSLRGGVGNGMGQGGGGGAGMGHGDGGDAGWNRENMQIIHKLLEHRGDIERTVTPATEDGLGITVTKTTSKDTEVEQWIKTHVTQMMDLVESGGRIRNWDPLFRAIFDHPKDIDSEVTTVDGGVEVILTGATECGKSLSYAHAEVVSAFLSNGYEELHRSHQVPTTCDE
jgi:uncharacterized protein